MNRFRLRSALAVTASALAVAAGSLVGCGNDRSVPTAPNLEDTGTFVGGPQDIGDGTARAWAELDAGDPVRIGVTLSEGALSGLSALTQALSLPLPAEARAATLFDHVLLTWNPVGHPPGGVYSAPHFDFYFYTVPAAARLAIPWGQAEERTPVIERFLPPDYTPVSRLIGSVGEHWADSTSAEFEGAFDRALLYVSYEGRVIAVEPKATREHLMLRRGEVVPIKQPAAVQRSGHYPAAYRIRYDEAAREYRVTLEDFVARTRP